MALIHPELVQAAVRIRNQSGDVWGTGFGYARPDDYDKTKPQVHSTDERWRLWYVTCAHVIDAIEASQFGNQQIAYIELNEEAPKGGITSVGYPVGHYWTRHREWTARCSQFGPIGQRHYSLEDAAVDVAVTTAPTHYSKWHEIDVCGFPPRMHMTKALMTADSLVEQPLNEGDDLFIIGFPTGFYGDMKNWPTVRHGVLAQIQPYLRGSARTFLVDGSVFGGNSGGPVVTKPQATSIRGTQLFNRNALIGMVSGCRLDPKRGENADLGIVVPLDTINETIEMALSESAHVSRV